MRRSHRGGTSKALVLHRADLPDNQADWEPVFLAAMGSSDPNGRQLDGMGGGVSSLSKVCVVAAEPRRRRRRLHLYTFAPVLVGAALVDHSANCGNVSSAIGPFALDEGLVPAPEDPEAVVRIYNTKTGKIICRLNAAMSPGSEGCRGSLSRAAFVYSNGATRDTRCASPNNSSDRPKSAQATKQLGQRFHCKKLHQTAHSHSCERYQRFGFDRAFLVNNAG